VEVGFVCLPRPLHSVFSRLVSSRQTAFTDHHRKPSLSFKKICDPMIERPVREPGFPSDDGIIVARSWMTGTIGGGVGRQALDIGAEFFCRCDFHPRADFLCCGLLAGA
jgi:hypothetical protein